MDPERWRERLCVRFEMIPIWMSSIFMMFQKIYGDLTFGVFQSNQNLYLIQHKMYQNWPERPFLF